MTKTRPVLRLRCLFCLFSLHRKGSHAVAQPATKWLDRKFVSTLVIPSYCALVPQALRDPPLGPVQFAELVSAFAGVLAGRFALDALEPFQPR